MCAKSLSEPLTRFRNGAVTSGFFLGLPSQTAILVYYRIYSEAFYIGLNGKYLGYPHYVLLHPMQLKFKFETLGARIQHISGLCQYPQTLCDSFVPLL